MAQQCSTGFSNKRKVRARGVFRRPANCCHYYSNDLYVFKVPILRNVEMTPPYFHDGSVGLLREAIAIMANIQLKIAVTDSQIEPIDLFLQSLTGKIPDEFLIVPILPIGEAVRK